MGFLGKTPFSFLSPTQNRGEGGARRRRPIPAPWGTAAAGDGGKRERGSRGFDSPLTSGRGGAGRSGRGGERWPALAAMAAALRSW